MIKLADLAIISTIVLDFGMLTGHPLLGASVVVVLLMFATLSAFLWTFPEYSYMCMGREVVFPVADGLPFYWHWKHITLWQGNVSQSNESSSPELLWKIHSKTQ
ncbi:hypothetical protein ACOSQ3_021690 [Xanthoceras sorbifolium]